MRSTVVVLALCLATGASAFNAPTFAPGTAMRVKGSAWCSSRPLPGRHLSLRRAGTGANLALQMSSDVDVEAERAEKRLKAMKLAEQAKAALAEAEKAEQQVSLHQGAGNLEGRSRCLTRYKALDKHKLLDSPNCQRPFPEPRAH